jgi:hypothetical protein
LLVNYRSNLSLQPVLSPRCLRLIDTVAAVTKKDLNFKTSVLAVRLSRTRLVVVLQDRTFIYDVNSTTILEEIETVPNTKGEDPTAVCSWHQVEGAREKDH